MKVISIQIALFFKDLVSRPDYLAEQINKKLGNIFDAMPICIDLPLEAPAEIPVVQRKSTTVPHSLNISRNRSDLTLYPMQENNQLQIIENRYSETIFYKGIMPSEKVLDFPVDCNTLTGSVNL